MSMQEINLEEFETIDIVEKLSQNSIKFNERLIELNKHLLCYYSDIPPYFYNKKQLPANFYPKQGIQILNIFSIEKEDENNRTKKRPNVFKITFNKQHLIEFKKYGKDIAQKKQELIQYYQGKQNNSTQLQISDLKNSKSKTDKPDQKTDYVQWLFRFKFQKERDEFFDKIATLIKYLNDNLESEMRDKKSKEMELLYTSYKTSNGTSSVYTHPNINDYNSSHLFHKDIKPTYKGGLQQIEEETWNDRNMQSVDYNELPQNNESSNDIGAASASYKGEKMPSNINKSQMINQNRSKLTNPQSLLGGDIMSQEEEKDQYKNQQMRQEQRQFSVNQQFENMITLNHIKPTESFLTKKSYDEEDSYQLILKKEEEQRKKEIYEEEERKRQEKEEIERIKKQKEEEEQRKQNKLVYDSSYELQYQDKLNSTNLLQSIIDNPAQLLVSSSNQLYFDQSQNLQIDISPNAKFNPNQSISLSPTKKEKIEESFNKNYDLLSLIGTFNETAQNATKQLIEDLIFSGNQKKYIPIQIKNDQSFELANNDINFEILPSYEFLVEAKSYNNVVIKLSWITQENIVPEEDQQEQTDKEYNINQETPIFQMIEQFVNQQNKNNNIPQQRENQISPSKYMQSSVYKQSQSKQINQIKLRRQAKQREEQIKQMQDQQETQIIYSNYHGKSLQSEFKALNLINTWHIDHKSSGQQTLKVALSCIITYRGFKAFVQSVSSEAEGLVHGPVFNQDKYYQGYKTHPQIVPLLQKIGEDLGIKPHTFTYGNKPKCQIYLSFVTEVHQSQNITNLRKQINDPQQMQYQKLETYYIKNVGDIFPVNDNYLSENLQSKTIQFRPEYLKKLDTQLNPDAFEDSDPDSQEDVKDIVQSSIYLESTYIQRFLYHLDELNYSVIDSLSLQECMHKEGINMKYLGFIAQNTSLPFIQNLCLTDMVARAFKKILNFTISDIYLRFNKFLSQDDYQLSLQRQKQATFQQIQGNPLTPQQQAQQNANNQLREQKIKQLDELVKEAVIDILNLLYGKDDETVKFHEILCQQIKYDFNYDQTIDIKSLQRGYLLESICFHCDLNMVYSTDLFTRADNLQADLQNNQKGSSNLDDLIFQQQKQSQQIFTKDNYIDHYVSSQVFTMDCLSVMQYIKSNELNRLNKEFIDQQISAIKQNIKVLKCTNSLSFFKYVQLTSALSELYLQKKDYLNCCKSATEVITLCTKKIDEELVIVPNIYLVKVMIYLIQINLKKDISLEIKNMTTLGTKNIMKMIKFVVDDYHPLFYELTRIFIDDKLIKRDLSNESVKQVMESELNGLTRSLGLNHLLIAERYHDFAVYMYDQNNQTSIVYFDKAFRIYTVNKEYQDKDIALKLINPISPSNMVVQVQNLDYLRANCAYYLSILYFNQNKLNQSWVFLEIALEFFKNRKDSKERLDKLQQIQRNILASNQKFN
ncbi:hypothetical protein ABPG74_021075 [Tetrahymena malaccensis]